VITGTCPSAEAYPKVHTKFSLRFWLKLSSDPSLAALFLQSPLFRGVKFYIPVTLVWFLQAPLLYCLLIPSFQGFDRTFTDSILTIPVARLLHLVRKYDSFCHGFKKG
jgi:hypothetical protein